MSPERARVFVIEDGEDYRSTVEEYLEAKGHTVVLVAETMKEAVEKIESLDSKDVDVVVLDGNLSPGKYKGEEGAFLAELIKDKHPDIKIIGASLRDDIPGVDVNSTKIRGLVELEKTVTDL